MLSKQTLASATLALLISLVSAEDLCLSGLACRPWSLHSPCAAGGSMDTRFLIETWSESTALNTYGQSAFCPLVDQNEAFVMTNLTDFIDGAFTEDNVSSSFNNTRIWVYGQGALSPDDHSPIQDGSGALFSYLFPAQGSPQFGTGCAAGELAVASFLMVNFTMTNGVYLYNHNGTSINGNPINSGWLPTCDGTQCLFGDPACIGMGGLMNCARCYDATDVDTAMTRVWAAFYGTDSQGRTFVSGQDNPLNFLQYASGSAYTEIANNL